MKIFSLFSIFALASAQEEEVIKFKYICQDERYVNELRHDEKLPTDGDYSKATYPEAQGIDVVD